MTAGLKRTLTALRNGDRIMVTKTTDLRVRGGGILHARPVWREVGRWGLAEVDQGSAAGAGRPVRIRDVTDIRMEGW